MNASAWLSEICPIKNDCTILDNEGTEVKNTAPVCASVMGNRAVLHEQISAILYSPAHMPSKIISDYTSDNAQRTEVLYRSSKISG